MIKLRFVYIFFLNFILIRVIVLMELMNLEIHLEVNLIAMGYHLLLILGRLFHILILIIFVAKIIIVLDLYMYLHLCFAFLIALSIIFSYYQQILIHFLMPEVQNHNEVVMIIDLYINQIMIQFFQLIVMQFYILVNIT
jgi:hypothetical protein